MQLQGLTDHHHEESAVQTWQWDICAIELVTIVMTIIQVSLVWFGVAHGMISLTPGNFMWFLKLTWASLLMPLVPPGVAPEPLPQHGSLEFSFLIPFPNVFLLHQVFRDATGKPCFSLRDVYIKLYNYQYLIVKLFILWFLILQSSLHYFLNSDHWTVHFPEGWRRLDNPNPPSLKISWRIGFLELSSC